MENEKLEENLLKKQASEKQYNYYIILDNNFNNLKQILDETI